MQYNNKKNEDIYTQVLILLGVILLPGLIILLMDGNLISAPTGIILTLIYILVGYHLLKDNK